MRWCRTPACNHALLLLLFYGRDFILLDSSSETEEGFRIEQRLKAGRLVDSGCLSLKFSCTSLCLYLCQSTERTEAETLFSQVSVTCLAVARNQGMSYYNQKKTDRDRHADRQTDRGW